ARSFASPSEQAPSAVSSSTTREHVRASYECLRRRRRGQRRWSGMRHSVAQDPPPRVAAPDAHRTCRHSTICSTATPDGRATANVYTMSARSSLAVLLVASAVLAGCGEPRVIGVTCDEDGCAPRPARFATCVERELSRRFVDAEGG